MIQCQQHVTLFRLYEGRMSPITTEICWHTSDDTHFGNNQTLVLLKVIKSEINVHNDAFYAHKY